MALKGSKKIAILVAGLPPVYNGGTEIATVNIARYAAEAGHEVHIIAADGTRQGVRLYGAQERGYKVHRVQTIPIAYFYGLYYLPGAVRQVLKLKPDLVHAQGMYMGLVAYVANLVSGIPYLVYSRGEMYVKWPFKRQISRLVMRWANRVIAQTEDMRHGLQAILSRDVEVIPNGVDLQDFVPMSKSEARTKLGLQPNSKFVLFVGRARPEKNLFGFVETMDYLRGRGDCCAIVVGDGPQLSRAKCLANSLDLSNITFKGNVDNKDVPLYMYASDVLVNTSFSEGFPTTFLEAMASGLPIVAPSICGVPEIVENGANGILVEPKNPELMALAVNRILNDSDLAKAMSRNNLKKAKQYSWENVVEKLYDKET